MSAPTFRYIPVQRAEGMAMDHTGVNGGHDLDTLMRAFTKALCDGKIRSRYRCWAHGEEPSENVNWEILGPTLGLG